MRKGRIGQQQVEKIIPFHSSVDQSVRNIKTGPPILPSLNPPLVRMNLKRPLLPFLPLLIFLNTGLIAATPVVEK